MCARVGVCQNEMQRLASVARATETCMDVLAAVMLPV